MDLRLSGSRVIVTGASRGIGRAIALQFALEGAKLLLVARGAPGLDAVAKEAAGLGAEVELMTADVLDETAPDAIAARAVARFGGIDILIANAGGSFGRGLADTARAEWRKTYEMNVLHAVDLLKSCVPHMPPGTSSAVFVSSISGRLPVSRRAQYAAAKAGLTHAARSLALELVSAGIRVNSVSPGSTIFEGGGWERRSRESPEAFDAFIKSHPGGRLGRPDEIAAAVVFVASPVASWINATDIAVDGGQRRPSID
jgi:3-oxoacyl-[acyl-carrier protein] reductase